MIFGAGMTLSYSSSFSSSSSKLALASAPSLASCEEPPASAVWLVTIKASFFEDEDENENENESYRDASLAGAPVRENGRRAVEANDIILKNAGHSEEFKNGNVIFGAGMTWSGGV